MNESRHYNYDPYRTAPRTWRSATSFESLSKSMEKALRDALSNGNLFNCKKSTTNALIKRGFCDQDGKLTDEGRVAAIGLSSLKQQARALSLPINNIELIICKNERPEIAVTTYLLNECHYKAACYAEGGDIKTLLGCMSFDVIRNAWKEHCLTHPLYKGYHEDFGESSVEDTIMDNMYVSPLGSIDLLDLMENRPNTCSENRPSPYKYLMPHIMEAITNAKKDHIKKSFNTLKQWHIYMGCTADNWPLSNYVGLTLSFVLSLYEALGNKVIVDIAKMFFMDPAAFGSGWPDITAIDRNNNIKLFEVKTTDKLHRSQIITIWAMANFFQIELIRVKRIGPKYEV
jgi:hypothetical protein